MHAASDEVELVVSPWPGMRCQPWSRVTAQLRLVHPVMIALDKTPHWWSFDSPSEDGDVLDDLVGRTVGWRHLPMGSTPRAHAHALLHSLVTHAAGLAMERADACTLAKVRGLAPRTRSFAYAALLADERGHFAQALAAWPGLVALAAHHTSSDLIARLILDGRSIRDIVDGTLGAERARPGARRLVRFAPCDLDGAALRGVIEAPGIDVNDLPSGPVARRTWYRWAAAWRAVIERRPQGSPIRVGGFVSRHALELEALARDADVDAEALVTELLDHIDHTTTPPPGRSSSPALVVARLRTWHEALWSLELDRDTALPIGPAAPIAPSPLVVTPIATVGALVAEGRTMHHCVATYAGRAAAGELCFYKVTLGDERLTVAVTYRHGRWRIIEASGPCNRRPTPRARRQLDAWLATRGDAPLHSQGQPRVSQEGP